MNKGFYTVQLQAGLGLIEETRKLLDLWSPDISGAELTRRALESGQFPNVTSRRLKNIVTEGFKPRYMVNNGAPAMLLKSVIGKFSNREFNQLLFVNTCRAHLILEDFVREVYWNTYSSGKGTVSIDDARKFVQRANEDGKTLKPWSESTLIRMSSYLCACCADFGLLEPGEKKVRSILPFQIEARVLAILAYDFHFEGLGDNSVLNHSDWKLFGMERDDVLNEFKRHARKGWFIVQSAGEIARIGWQAKNKEELFNVIFDG